MKTITAILGWIVSIAVPFILMMTAIRLLITPVFLQVEYRTPDFPSDPYGFSFADRLHWSQVAVDYLVNDQGIQFLGDLKKDDGTALYNDRELSHMVDVKVLVQKMIVAWYILLVAFLLTGILAWRVHVLPNFWWAVFRGGWLTIGLILAILAGTAINFEGLFTAFHELFFTGSSWIFLYSDTLIRLFPLRFWRDGFIMMGGFTILGALLAAFGGKWLAARKAAV